ncbi:MAG: M1 family aminopeptidase [Myxococcaceae bacterium]
MSEHCAVCLGAGASGPHPFPFPTATPHYAADRPVRAEHLRLEVSLDFERREVTGTALTRVRAVREVRELTFDAVALEVEWVLVDDRRARFENTGRLLRVELPNPLAEGESAEVSVRYRCRPTRGLYFLAPDEAYPSRPRQVWTQGQDQDSRCWFPCLDAPAQKATSELSATFPASMIALSNGTKVFDEATGELRTTRYRLDVPHPAYLVTLVVGELEEEVADSGKTRLRYLFPPGRKEDALRCCARTPEMVRLFEELTAEPYPYGVYSQVFVADFIFGGMENTSATTLTERTLHDERAHLDYSAEPLISHELAHQWFGDLLTCREWPQAWLNEGFATYLEVLWKERVEGRDEADQQRRADLDLYLEEAGSRYERAIVERRFDNAIELFDRHLYEKGALVLHELRRRLGDELFKKTLRAYVAKNRTQAVETVDLARAVEEATGRNLDGFFDQYVHSPGHPQLKVEVTHEPEEKRLRVKVSQKQKTGEGDSPVYRLPLPVRVVAGGRTEEHTLEVTLAEQGFLLSVAGSPSQVLVDARREVLGTLEVDKPLGWWLAELEHAPEARARTEAALSLAKDPSAQAVEALGAALRGDPFWATQAACAKALGMSRTPAAKKALLAALTVKHPKARRAVVAALGEFRRDEEVAGALRALCQKGDPSYFVESEAARSYGKLRVEGALPLLEELMRRPSFQDVIATGAVDGMAESLNPEAWPVVERLTRYGESEFLRRAAAVAMGKLAEAAGRKRETADRLGELLRDPQLRVQMGTFEAVRELGDARMIAALEATAYLDPRVKRGAREAARALREGEPQRKEVSVLRDEIDRLKAETREIRERIDALGTKRAAAVVKAKGGGRKPRRR